MLAQLGFIPINSAFTKEHKSRSFIHYSSPIPSNKKRKGRTITIRRFKNGRTFESLCIRVPKVYDWVRRQVVLPQIFTNDTSLFEEEALKDLGHDVEVEIVLTDSEGHPVDPSDEDALDNVIELVPHGGRRPKKIVLPDGEVVVLHEVKLSISGFYRVKLIELNGHHKHDEVESSVIPWKIHQTFYLCAPEGTEPVVHLESFEGTDGSLRLSDCHLQQLSFDLMLCLSVQIEKRC